MPWLRADPARARIRVVRRTEFCVLGFVLTCSIPAQAGDAFPFSDKDGAQRFGRAWTYIQGHCRAFANDRDRLADCQKVAVMEITSMERAAGGADAYYEREAEKKSEDDAKERARAAANADPRMMRIALSAQLCAAHQDLRWADSEMRRYHAASGAIGIANHQKENGLASLIEEKTETAGRAMERLKEIHLGSMPCSVTLVRKVTICLSYSDDRACPDVGRPYADALPE